MPASVLVQALVVVPLGIAERRQPPHGVAEIPLADPHGVWPVLNTRPVLRGIGRRSVDTGKMPPFPHAAAPAVHERAHRIATGSVVRSVRLHVEVDDRLRAELQSLGDIAGAVGFAHTLGLGFGGLEGHAVAARRASRAGRLVADPRRDEPPALREHLAHPRRIQQRLAAPTTRSRQCRRSRLGRGSRSTTSAAPRCWRPCTCRTRGSR